jgi:hypothetical protein
MGHRCQKDKTTGLGRWSELSNLDCTWKCKAGGRMPTVRLFKNRELWLVQI